MRDDFEITTDHIDLIADTAVRAGALGARMTGGGFGGCVIALVAADKVDGISDAVRRAVDDAGYNEPTITRTTPGRELGRSGRICHGSTNTVHLCGHSIRVPMARGDLGKQLVMVGTDRTAT